MTIDEAIVRFANIIAENNNYEQKNIEIVNGRRYAKLVNRPNYGGRSVVAFIDRKNGDIYKPQTWKAPLPHARGNVMTETEGREALDPSGQYVRYLI